MQDIDRGLGRGTRPYKYPGQGIVDLGLDAIDYWGGKVKKIMPANTLNLSAVDDLELEPQGGEWFLPRGTGVTPTANKPGMTAHAATLDTPDPTDVEGFKMGAAGVPGEGAVLPSSTGVIARGEKGEPLFTNQPGAEPWRGFRRPIAPLRPAQMSVLPDAGSSTRAASKQLNYDEGDFIPATGQRTSLRSMEGTGGGQVIQGQMDPETAALVAARQAAVLPAQESYLRTLDESNLMEGAHGPAQARRMQALIADRRNKAFQAYKDKWGYDLKAAELQATLPKLQAETESLKAQSRKYDAEAAAQPFRAKNMRSQTLHDMIVKYTDAMTKPDITLDEEQNAKRTEDLRAQVDNLWQLLEMEESKGRGGQSAQAANAAKPTREQFIAKAKQSNPGYTDDEIAAEYEKRYGGK